LSGMVPMYVLMSAFHFAPWLKLISRRPSGIESPVHERTGRGATHGQEQSERQAAP
jgi:hypothetical protein